MRNWLWVVALLLFSPSAFAQSTSVYEPVDDDGIDMPVPMRVGVVGATAGAAPLLLGATATAVVGGAAFLTTSSTSVTVPVLVGAALLAPPLLTTVAVATATGLIDGHPSTWVMAGTLAGQVAGGVVGFVVGTAVTTVLLSSNGWSESPPVLEAMVWGGVPAALLGEMAGAAAGAAVGAIIDDE